MNNFVKAARSLNLRSARTVPPRRYECAGSCLKYWQIADSFADDRAINGYMNSDSCPVKEEM